MKKLTLFILAVFAFSLSVQAQELKNGVIEVGDYENPTEFYNGSYFDMAPTNFYLAHTGAQMIYTPAVLSDLQGKENVKIKELSFKCNSQTFEEIYRKMKIYLQEWPELHDGKACVLDGISSFAQYKIVIS